MLLTGIPFSYIYMYIVARGRSLFGDPTSEIQELTQVIKQDLAKLNSDIADLQQRVKSQSYNETKHMRSHSSSVVVSLQSKLVDISKDFKGVLELRTEVLNCSVRVYIAVSMALYKYVCLVGLNNSTLFSMR